MISVDPRDENRREFGKGAIMSTVVIKNKSYAVDSAGFLMDSCQWDEDFAEGTAGELGITGGLQKEHWEVINFIRRTFKETGTCPLVYQTCRMKNIDLAALKMLFPSGYLRGACRLAGITYKEGYLDQAGLDEFAERISADTQEKTYRIDVRGFLIDPDEWDEKFALFTAYNMKMPGRLKSDHWKVIHFLRESYKRNHIVPTVYETCEVNDLELRDLEILFPDGYHRGAVKLAGLRVR
jgi:TusE/DsrC/DsvC family sulfur relay protein